MNTIIQTNTLIVALLNQQTYSDYFERPIHHIRIDNNKGTVNIEVVVIDNKIHFYDCRTIDIHEMTDYMQTISLFHDEILQFIEKTHIKLVT